MKMLFSVFGIPIHFFGIMIVLGIVTALVISSREIKRKGLNLSKFYDLATYMILASIIGARIFYILFYRLSYYLENPVDIFKVYEGGLSVHGGIVGGLIVAMFYVKKHRLDFWQYADAVIPGVILAQGIGRVGCDVFGKPMDQAYIWGIQYQGTLVHPVQLYEAILNYIVFYVLWKKRKQVRYKGQLFVWYLIFFSFNRGIVELFRYNPTLIGWFSISHLLSVVFILLGLLLGKILKKNLIDEAHREVTDTKHSLGALAMLILLAAASIMVFYAVQS